MKISKRLVSISNYIEDNSCIIDVGCDHALLDIYLFKNKKNVKLIASDVKEGPLEQAKKNIEKYHCNIQTKLGYGISTIEDDIDTIVIAGMGGDTIIDILKAGENKLSHVDKMIISPHSEWMKIRRVCTSLGFYIDDETIIEDGNQYYLIIKFVRGEREYSNEEMEFGPVLLTKKSKEFMDYYQGVLEEKMQILKKIPLCQIKKRIKERKQIIFLKKILKNE